MGWDQLLVLAASAFLNYQNNRAAVKRQKNLASKMEAFQKDRSAQSMAATEELLKKQTPEARGTELADIAAAREQSLRDTVGAAQAFDAPETAGKKSTDYQRAQEQQATSVAARTKRAIEQLSAMGAPGEQQRAHNLRFGRAAGVVDASNVASENVGRRYLTDIRNVKPNPFIDLVSQIGTGYALGGMGGEANVVNNGQGYTDAADNLYSGNVTRQQRLNRGFSLWGR